MDRRQGLVAIALIGLAAVAALWIVLDSTRGSRRPDAPPRGSVAAAPPLLPAVRAVGLSGRKPRAKHADPAAESTSAPGTLVVHVRSTASATIAGAHVVVMQDDGEHVAETTAEGIARFVVVAGSLGAFATAEGYAGTTSKDVEVPEGSEASVEVVLDRGIPFDGVVVDAEDGRPLGDVEIDVSDNGPIDGDTPARYPGLYDEASSAADGRFHVRGVPDGHDVSLDVRAAHHVEGFLLISVAGGVVTPHPLVLRVAPAARLVGVVRGPDGAGVADATVYALPTSAEKDLKRNLDTGFHSGETMPWQRAYQSATDESGAYAVDGIPPDEEYVAVAGDNEHGGRRELALSAVATGIRFRRPALEAHQDFALSALASLVVRPVDLDGHPVEEGVAVRMEDPSGLASNPHFARQDDEGKGTLRVDSLSPGDGRIEVSGPMFLTAEVPVHIEAGKTSEVVVHLDPGASVEGIAVDEAGTPLPGVQVEITPIDVDHGNATMRSAETDARGRFLLRSVERKPSDVRARGISANVGGADLATLESLRVQPPATGVRLVLVRLGGATLRLVRSDGTPYAGEASAWSDGESGGVSGVTTDGGLVRWSGLGEGGRTFRVTASGFVPVQGTFVARLRADVDLGRAVLDPGAVVKVVLRDSAGRRAEARSLHLVRIALDGRPDAARAEEWDWDEVGETYGTIAWRVAPGRWQVFAESEDASLPGPMGPPLADWTFAEGEKRDVELRLPAR